MTPGNLTEILKINFHMDMRIHARNLIRIFERNFENFKQTHSTIFELRGYHTTSVPKALRKAAMRRSYLNEYLRKLDDHSLRTYRKQKIYCSVLY